MQLPYEWNMTLCHTSRHRSCSLVHIYTCVHFQASEFVFPPGRFVCCHCHRHQCHMLSLSLSPVSHAVTVTSIKRCHCHQCHTLSLSPVSHTVTVAGVTCWTVTSIICCHCTQCTHKSFGSTNASSISAFKKHLKSFLFNLSLIHI